MNMPGSASDSRDSFNTTNTSARDVGNDNSEVYGEWPLRQFHLTHLTAHTKDVHVHDDDDDWEENWPRDRGATMVHVRISVLVIEILSHMCGNR